MELLAICPGNITTGGPEAIHEFVSNMNKLDGIHARLWYWNVRHNNPMPDAYRKYGCEFVTDLPSDFDGVLVFPEIWANEALNYPQYTRAVWWLGVDAYAAWNIDRGAFLKDDSIIHIAQSEYAYQFLRQLRVKHLYKCGDLLNADFYDEPWTESERSDMVLFNPAKATPFMQTIIDACPDITFKPITGMTREQVIDTMRHNKLYVDFGEFPGRERMPREAVLCGCCLITSRLGSAAYYEDFSHSYKYESKDSHIWAIVNQIRYVLSHYEECRHDFDMFRELLRAEAVLLSEQYKQLKGAFYEIQHSHSGV